MGRLIKSAIIGGVVYMLWIAVFGFIHGNEVGFSKFRDQDAVFEVLKENISGSGVYYYPLPSDEVEGGASFLSMMREGPVVYVDYSEGISNLGTVVLLSILFAFLVAFITASLLQVAPGLSFFGKALFVMFVASTGEVGWHLQNFLMPAYSAAYTLLAIASTIIGWFLAGMAMAKWGVKTEELESKG